jgi:folate-binding protein YgfZ
MGGHDNGGMSLLRPPPASLHGHLPLTDWGVIRASGDEARSFLHNQLTQDVANLERGRARLAGYCSPKGRLLATFVIWLDADGDVLLACSRDLLAPTLKRLSMFVLRSKCRLVDASETLPLHGVAGPEAAAGSQDGDPPWRVLDLDGGGQSIRLPDGAGVPRALWVGAAPPTGPAIAPQAWRWLEVASGVPRIVAATSEAFVPQMINLELVGGVNFQKGCYPGQEVVARSQYRGTLKRRAYLMQSPDPIGSSGGAPEDGQEVFDTAHPDQPAGRVVLAAVADGAPPAVLVELKIASADADLRVGTPDGPPLRRADLPYALPSADG